MTHPPADTDPPLRVELQQAEDHHRYLLRNATEILFVLRAMMRKRDHITAYFEASDEFLLTTLLAVEDDGLVLDYGSDEAANARTLAAQSLTLVASHERVRIQFDVPGFGLARFGDGPAFRAAMPRELLRLQRREYFRLMAAGASALRCQIFKGTQEAFATQVLDISGGGLAIVAPPPDSVFAVGSQFDDCRLELPEAGVIKASLRVRNVFDVTLRNGTRVRRCGCQFVNLSGASLSLIERYIMRMERERKARESRL